MRESTRARRIAYGVAVLGTGVSLLMRWPLMPCLGHRAPLMTFFPVIIVSAYLGGLGPGLVATFLGAALADYFLLVPLYSFAIAEPSQIYALVMYLLAGVVISALTESLLRSRRHIAASQRRYAITLASIGDAVIATDTQVRITFLNPVAEALTGWPLAEAVGRPLTDVFRIVNEKTRQPVENPAAKVLRLGRVVGLANHTALLARDGREVPIDDCGAPIIDDHGAITGVVLVFRDVSQRRQAEEAEVLRRVNERMNLAVRGSNVGVWDIDMPDGDFQHGRRRYMNIWEQFGHERPPQAWSDDATALPLDERKRSGWTDATTAKPLWETTGIELHPDDRARVEEDIRRYLAGETAEYETEARFRHQDGSYRTMLARGVAVRNAAGVPIRFVGILLDITRIKRAEEALRESEQRWRGLTEALPQLVWSATPDGSCDYFSTQWTEHTGIAERDLLGWGWLETLHPEDRAPTRRFWLGSVAEHHAYDVEYRVRRHDGEYRWFKTRGVPIRDSNGRIFKWFGTCTDITELRQTHQALEASEHRFRIFVDHAADAFFLLDEQARIKDANQQACVSLGYSRDELIGMTPYDFDPDLTPGQVEKINFKLRVGEVVAFEARHRRKDGTIFPVEIRGKRFQENDRVFLVSLVRDITERRQAEEALRESEERFRGTFENAAVGIAHTSLGGCWIRVNTKLAAILGYTVEETLRLCWQDVTHPDDMTMSVEYLNALLRGERQSYTLEKRYFRKDGSLIWGHLAVSLQRDAAGQPAYIISVIQDISERKRLEAELLRARETAEAANRAKDEFLANVSHEIRTPFGAILGMTELVLDTPLSDDQRQCLQTVKSAGENLLAIINDLLDFSKIEAGKLELNLADFSLRTVVGDTLRVLAARAHKKGLELVYHVEPDVPDALIGDAVRLRQVLLNLVGNAIKFTEIGQVIVHVRCQESGIQSQESGGELGTDAETLADSCRLYFEVRDTGIGIAKAKQEIIFRAFEQEDTSTTRRYGGTGLGLTIASRLVALMDGKITVESEPGRGSLFTFTARFGLQPYPLTLEDDLQPALLPSEQGLTVIEELDEGAKELLRSFLAPAGEARHPARESSFVAASARAPGMCILVAEDNELNADLLKMLLGRQGHQVHLAHDGREALRLAQEGGCNLLLLDVHMPEMDGFQVAQAIREHEQKTGGHLPIIALTARARKEDRERCLAAGMDDFLSKPTQPADLWAAIDRVVKVRPPARPPESGLIDARVLLASCGGHSSILKSICTSLQNHLPGQLKDVQDAWRHQDAPRLRETAHKLAGLVAAFSSQVGGVASELEDQAAQGQLEEARPLVEQLEAMTPILLRQVETLSLDALRAQAESASVKSKD